MLNYSTQLTSSGAPLDTAVDIELGDNSGVSRTNYLRWKIGEHEGNKYCYLLVTTHDDSPEARHVE